MSATGGSGTGAVTYSAGSSTGCSVSGTTLLITNASGSCIVTATKAADTNYHIASAVTAVTLQKATGSISINNIPASATYGGSFTPTFTKSGDGLASVASTTIAICSVAAGVVYYVGIGTCTIQASVAEGTNHLAATGSLQSFTIIYDNGPLITDPDDGYGGAPVSVIQPGQGGYGVLNARHNIVRVADDFTVTGSGWQIDQITFYSVMSTSSGVPNPLPWPMSGVNLRIWDGSPDDP